MERKKIAMLFPYAPAYRELIYRKMDEDFDVDWYFCGNAERPLKLLNYSLLKNCNLTMREQRLPFSFLRYKGIKNLKLDSYYAIIAAPVIKCTSIWWLVYHFGSKKQGPKVFFWSHGWYGKETIIEKIVKRIFHLKVDGFLLYNNRAKDLMINIGFDKSKLHVVYNSLDYDKQILIRKSLQSSKVYLEHFMNSNKNIVFIGRLTKVKRFDLLIDAVTQLKYRGELVNVTFIGDGVERQNMEAMVAEKGIKDQVWFYGACYDEKTNAELIYNADLCVSPGNIGLTAMHVLMFGCPAITNDDFAHQMPEFEAIKPNVTGDFFHANDAVSLADTISNWFKSHQNDKDFTREACYSEIDSKWNPNNQISVIKQAVGL